MLKKHIADELRRNLKFTPTLSQETAILKLSEFLAGKGEKQIMLLKGFAGTGKTTLISALVKTLDQVNIEPVLLAPTGRAAKVLSAYCAMPASTIHRKIYRLKSKKDILSGFILDKNYHSNTLFIVDEASMITNTPSDSSLFGSGRLLSDLIDYVHNGKSCRLLMTGDTAQLPPVGLQISPALDSSVAGSFGYQVSEVVMTDVVRQSLDSGILFNATGVRKLITDSSSALPRFSLGGFEDIVRI
ncbi:MAG: AAA family ATPase, partial [Bacteroidia bacterium]|nr:AAA family ATPase [Bacteroidia bacterium]